MPSGSVCVNVCVSWEDDILKLSNRNLRSRSKSCCVLMSVVNFFHRRGNSQRQKGEAREKRERMTIRK